MPTVSPDQKLSLMSLLISEHGWYRKKMNNLPHKAAISATIAEYKRKYGLITDTKWEGVMERLRADFNKINLTPSGSETAEDGLKMPGIPDPVTARELYRRMEEFTQLYYPHGSSKRASVLVTPTGVIRGAESSAQPSPSTSTTSFVPMSAGGHDKTWQFLSSVYDDIKNLTPSGFRKVKNI